MAGAGEGWSMVGLHISRSSTGGRFAISMLGSAPSVSCGYLEVLYGWRPWLATAAVSGVAVVNQGEYDGVFPTRARRVQPCLPTAPVGREWWWWGMGARQASTVQDTAGTPSGGCRRSPLRAGLVRQTTRCECRRQHLLASRMASAGARARCLTVHQLTPLNRQRARDHDQDMDMDQGRPDADRTEV
ncbi:hypothetical protein T440DRAFT_508458 [Plenodomus tracheiphilus IPT5]|uniref:Uncharacterized protein n=1 Tax=Plenodomus tracheiphilus IPT5 TaxID=1408161 RepID=A0A6A7B6U1_9PLEO|nr:hypothetical protein T440DRAFT_508458 [Plenodomus tracheiphilus IPT5]